MKKFENFIFNFMIFSIYCTRIYCGHSNDVYQIHTHAYKRKGRENKNPLDPFAIKQAYKFLSTM